MKMHEEHRQFVFFLTGIFIGVLYIYFTGGSPDRERDFFSVQNLKQIMYMEIVHEDYFLFLLKKRIAVLLLLVIISFALPGKYLLMGFLMVFGCSIGSMLSVLVARYGIKGMLLFFGLVFPQDVIYIPVIFLWVRLMAGWNEELFRMRYSLMRSGQKHVFFMGKLLFLSGVTIIGVLSECYVNPIFVKWCLKFF